MHHVLLRWRVSVLFEKIRNAVKRAKVLVEVLVSVLGVCWWVA